MLCNQEKVWGSEELESRQQGVIEATATLKRKVRSDITSSDSLA